MRARKLKVQDVACELEVSCQTVYNWAHAWREIGVCGLLVGHKGGRPLAFPEAILATAIKVAGAESMTLRQIAQRYCHVVRGRASEVIKLKYSLSCSKTIQHRMSGHALPRLEGLRAGSVAIKRKGKIFG